MRRLLLASVLALAACGAAAAEDVWQGKTAAFFGVTFIDSSIEGELVGPRADEAARVEQISALLADAFVAHGVTLLDLAPVAEELDRIVNPAQCYGCEVRMAAKLGADYTIVAEVQKVSTLIQSMNVVVREAGTGAIVRARAVDLRGNTDVAWTRAMRYILEHAIFIE